MLIHDSVNFGDEVAGAVYKRKSSVFVSAYFICNFFFYAVCSNNENGILRVFCKHTIDIVFFNSLDTAFSELLRHNGVVDERPKSEYFFTLVFFNNIVYGVYCSLHAEAKAGIFCNCYFHSVFLLRRIYFLSESRRDFETLRR